MVLRVVAIIKKEPVVDLAVTADAPGDRFIGVGSVVPEIPVQVTETVPEIIKRQKIKDYITPVEQGQNPQNANESRQLNVAPDMIRVIPLFQFATNCCGVIPEVAQEYVAPRI